MSAFKEQIKADIGSTFFNLDEFCDWHLIDGKKMRVLFDKHELLERKSGSGMNATDGIYTDSMLIYVPCVDYGPRPRIDTFINLDGRKKYRIVDVNEEDGVFAFELEAVRSV